MGFFNCTLYSGLVEVDCDTRLTANLLPPPTLSYLPSVGDEITLHTVGMEI